MLRILILTTLLEDPEIAENSPAIVLYRQVRCTFKSDALQGEKRATTKIESIIINIYCTF